MFSYRMLEDFAALGVTDVYIADDLCYDLINVKKACKKRQWKENLKALYPQLEIDIWNQSILPELVKYKLNCRYKCIYGSVCKKCNQNVEIADNLHKKGFFYDLPKEGAKEL